MRARRDLGSHCTFAPVVGCRVVWMRGDTLKRRNIWVIVGVVVGVIVVVAGVALWNYHEQPQFCATCHIMQPYLESWQSSPFLAQAHAEESVTCLECHEPTIQQQVDELVKFVTNDYETPLEEREFDQEWCLRCHEHGSYEELIQRTEELEPNPHDSHYGEVECSVCHKVHRESEDYCAQCHASVVTGTGWITATEVFDWWEPDMDCGYCHVMESYTESLEDATLLAYAHAQEEMVCLDCHEQEVLEEVHREAEAGVTRLTVRKFSMEESCLDCHVTNEHTSYEEVIERTEGYIIDGKEINPHDPHAGVEGSEQELFECYSCHRMHKESSGINYCYGCHHAGTFENCSVCH
jgi:cytochrome c nitrite reductase small subunit